jgi:hypothetical protein
VDASETVCVCVCVCVRRSWPHSRPLNTHPEEEEWAEDTEQGLRRLEGGARHGDQRAQGSVGEAEDDGGEEVVEVGFGCRLETVHKVANWDEDEEDPGEPGHLAKEEGEVVGRRVIHLGGLLAVEDGPVREEAGDGEVHAQHAREGGTHENGRREALDAADVVRVLGDVGVDDPEDEGDDEDGHEAPEAGRERERKGAEKEERDDERVEEDERGR